MNWSKRILEIDILHHILLTLDFHCLKNFAKSINLLWMASFSLACAITSTFNLHLEVGLMCPTMAYLTTFGNLKSGLIVERATHADRQWSGSRMLLETIYTLNWSIESSCKITVCLCGKFFGYLQILSPWNFRKKCSHTKFQKSGRPVFLPFWELKIRTVGRYAMVS